ncbi:MAG TPA: hypothetical protein IAC03_03160 [Candidatus Coprenecus pullistercoris]|nr:hypothetical protein [Candidatus Coprenecus pullistercoris]
MTSDETKKWEYMKDIIFERLDRKMKEDKLYLNSHLTLPMLSDLTGTNRTYASRAICGRYKNFREYVNTLRVEHLLEDVQADRCGDRILGDPDEFANKYGFNTKRSLDRILVKETGCTYRKLYRRRRPESK